MGGFKTFNAIVYFLVSIVYTRFDLHWNFF
jgi:hypothetical protein